MVERRINLIRARKSAGFTQEALAGALHVSRETVNLWERGVSEPLPFRRPKLARLLDVSLTELEALLDDDRAPARVTGSTAGHDALTVIEQVVDAMKRRNLLGLLGTTAASAFVSPMFDELDPGEQERVIDAVIAPSRVDPAVLRHVEDILFDTLRTNDVFGPAIAMPTVLAQQQIAENIARDCPAALRTRALSALSNTHRIAGWISFNAERFGDARRYYGQARAIAHEAGDIALAAFTLANLAHLANATEQPAQAVDHALAAVAWANRADGENRPLRAFASDMSAIAHAEIGDEKSAFSNLDTTAEAHLPHCGANTGLSPFYFYSAGLHTARRGAVQLTLGHTRDAHDTITTSLDLYRKQDSPGNRTNIAVSTIELAELYHRIGDNTQAKTTLETVTPFLAATRSPRITTRVKKLRRRLEPQSEES